MAVGTWPRKSGAYRLRDICASRRRLGYKKLAPGRRAHNSLSKIDTWSSYICLPVNIGYNVVVICIDPNTNLELSHWVRGAGIVDVYLLQDSQRRAHVDVVFTIGDLPRASKNGTEDAIADGNEDSPVGLTPDDA